MGSPITSKNRLCQLALTDSSTPYEGPYDLVLPWLEMVWDQIASAIHDLERSLSPFISLSTMSEKTLEELTSSIESTSIYVDRVLFNLTSFLQCHTEAKTASMRLVLQDFHSLERLCKKLQRRAQVLMSRRVAALALEESRKSIEQSDSVRRLALLAYALSPFGLVAALFSMNVVEVQDASMASYFAWAVGISAISLLLWLFSGWWSRLSLLAGTFWKAKPRLSPRTWRVMSRRSMECEKSPV